jgi:glyoxylase-like metal-dependent hydrolase (beta-lactamase superfamily II)
MTSIIRKSPSTGGSSPDVWGIYEKDTGSVQYIVADPNTKKAALIDVVQNFDPRSAKASFESADEVLELAKDNGLTIEWV